MATDKARNEPLKEAAAAREEAERQAKIVQDMLQDSHNMHDIYIYIYIYIYMMYVLIICLPSLLTPKTYKNNQHYFLHSNSLREDEKEHSEKLQLRINELEADLHSSPPSPLSPPPPSSRPCLAGCLGKSYKI